MNKKIIIIGAVAAGTKCAAKLKRDKPDFSVNLYSNEGIVSYSACGLPYFIEGIVDDVNKLIVRTPEKFREQGINVFLNMQCITINKEEKYVVFKDLKDHQEYVEHYDKLVIATGSKPLIPGIANLNVENIFTLRTLNDGVKIKNAMKGSQKAVIIGGGYIGIELLEAFVKNNLPTVLIEASEDILPIFDKDFSKIIKEHIQTKDGNKLGIITHDSVIEILSKSNKIVGVKTKNGLEIPCDMAIIAVGVTPNTLIAKEAGLQLGIKETIKVSKAMQTSDPDIYAIGDCTEKYHLVSKEPCWIPLGSTANKEGRVCAINLAGGNEEFAGVLGSAVTRYFGFTMSISGLTERDAKRAGYEILTSTVTKKDRAGYMPDVQNISVKLVVDKLTRKILGIQGIGCGDVDKRVNAVTSSIQAGQSIDEFLNLDLTYAPPYSTAIDPLHNAAGIIASKLGRKI